MGWLLKHHFLIILLNKNVTIGEDLITSCMMNACRTLLEDNSIKKIRTINDDNQRHHKIKK